MEQYVPPQMPDTRPDMWQRALFVTSNSQEAHTGPFPLRELETEENDNEVAF